MTYLQVQDSEGIIISQVTVEDSFWDSFKDQICARVTNVHPDYLCTEIPAVNMGGVKPERNLTCMGEVGNWVASVGYQQ